MLTLVHTRLHRHRDPEFYASLKGTSMLEFGQHDDDDKDAVDDGEDGDDAASEEEEAPAGKTKAKSLVCKRHSAVCPCLLDLC